MNRARLERAARRLRDLEGPAQSGPPPVEEPPDIIEFATGPRHLGRTLYPRQATILKVVFLAVGLFTVYDWRVIEEWMASFESSGNRGVTSDLVRRIEICRAQGRPWFREVVAVIGRRGGKGYISAISLCVQGSLIVSSISRNAPASR